MSSSNSSTPTKSQYQHHIPRFVLRRFQIEGTQKEYKNAKERNKANKRALRKGIQLENILFFDFSSESVEIRPIATTYGMNDLYRDAKNVQDVDELEKKLAVLESEAAAVINILHEENGPCTIAPRRPQVETLRKFLFLMHYRSVRLSKTYFQRDHPDNTPIRQWLSEYRKKHNLNSDVDVWLHDLRYYLDTPHTQIIRDADAMVDQCGGLKVVEEMMKTHIDPGVENFSALAYKSQADFYFLCIWEAAENEEFTLGDNSFGLWEGRLLGKPGLHRLFAVGPRIVIILRDVHLDPALGPLAVPLGAVNSDLAAIPQDRPKPIYSNSALTPEDLAQHRLSAGAKKDKFEFKVTKLTRDQTFEVNKVFLENVRTDGSLTFISKERTLSTLRQYLRHPTSWPMNDVHKTTPKYRKLLSILEADVASMSQNILPQNPTNPSPSSVDQLNAELGTSLAGLQVSDEPKADAKVMPNFGMKPGFLNKSTKTKISPSKA